MSNEPNKPIEAQELKEKELEGVVGGRVREPVLQVQPILQPYRPSGHR